MSRFFKTLQNYTLSGVKNGVIAANTFFNVLALQPHTKRTSLQPHTENTHNLLLFFTLLVQRNSLPSQAVTTSCGLLALYSKFNRIDDVLDSFFCMHFCGMVAGGLFGFSLGLGRAILDEMLETYNQQNDSVKTSSLSQ